MPITRAKVEPRISAMPTRTSRIPKMRWIQPHAVTSNVTMLPWSVTQYSSSRNNAARPWIAFIAPITIMKTAAKTTQPTQPVAGSVYDDRYSSGADM
jgi:late competence protein required for DNA uptake (superfamily II DNA/RNA helicase)